MAPELLSTLEPDSWWALPWPDEQAPWRAWRSALGFVVLESPALQSEPDTAACLQALQMGLMAPWLLPARLVLREQTLHLQVALNLPQVATHSDLAAALLEDLKTTQDLLAQWAQEEPQPEPSADAAPPSEALAMGAMTALLELLARDPDLGPISELDEESAELSIGQAEDADWFILMRPLPVQRAAVKVAVMLPQALLPAEEPALHEALRQHLRDNDALRMGPDLQWVADAGGQQFFLQGLIDPQTCTLELLRLIVARLLALDAELSGQDILSPAAPADSLRIFLSGLRA